MISGVDLIYTKPILLNPRNFTSLNRTPWAGMQLAKGIKKNFVDTSNTLIGESWEFSCDRSAPSALLNNPERNLEQVISENPSAALSPELVRAGHSGTHILIKLINAASPLSLQIHPMDHHPRLKDNECGKPESWLVLSADGGAGLYLGFSRAFDPGELEHHLRNDTFDPNWLQFVPVKKGDYFEIGPGVPHAIGPGIVLLEPQKISPNKSGKTWRMWDWGRKYDSRGQLDAKEGHPRELHIAESLSLLPKSMQVGEAFATSLRRSPATQVSGHSTISTYPANGYYQLIHGTTTASEKIVFEQDCHYGAFTVLGGTADLRAQYNINCSESVHTGQTAFLPYGCLPLILETSSQVCEWTLVVPQGLKQKTRTMCRFV